MGDGPAGEVMHLVFKCPCSDVVSSARAATPRNYPPTPGQGCVLASTSSKVRSQPRSRPGGEGRPYQDNVLVPEGDSAPARNFETSRAIRKDPSPLGLARGADSTHSLRSCAADSQRHFNFDTPLEHHDRSPLFWDGGAWLSQLYQYLVGPKRILAVAGS